MAKFIKNYTQPAFLICAAVLLIAGVGLNAAVKHVGIYLTKLPLELQNPLSEIDKSILDSYEVKYQRQIKNKDILKSLGTEQYIDWYLEDKNATANSPTRYCSLFITYYTGDPDPVPHVPDECYVGAGKKSQAVATVTFDLSGADNSQTGNNVVPQNIDARYIEFISEGTSALASSARSAVMYFFKANGQYCGNRTETRTTLGKNLFSKYSYYAKVEMKFSGQNYSGSFSPTKQEAVKAAEKLLTKLLPELEENHWPDWQAANSKDK